MNTVSYELLKQADLVIDAVYESDRRVSKGLIVGEPLSPLMGVGNMGGFRVRKGKEGVLFAVITSSGSEVEWPDSLDPFTGIYTYFGDNRQPGTDMHKTKKRGNSLLRDAFELAHSGRAEDRKKCPIFFVFEQTGTARDYVFRGMAVPGSEYLTPGEDLIAVWRTIKGQRFQNYRASFSILDESVISGNWLRTSITAREFDLGSPDAPQSLVRWVKTGKVQPLLAEKIGVRKVEEQLPQHKTHKALIATIYDLCSSDPWLFERVAAEIWKISSPAPASYEITPRYKDGGRDALGAIKLGPSSDSISLSFALEAKLYGEKNTVGVKEVSRLISRIKHREFGVLVTTSALNSQAYKEIREDKHPIIVIAGRDIAEILISNGIATSEECETWVKAVIASEY